MINFKDPKDQTASALAVIGMVLIGASVIVTLFFLKGIDANAYSAKARKDQTEFEKRREKAKSDQFVYKDAVDKYLWTDKEDVVTPTALTIISKRAEESNLKLISFRPLKSSENATGVVLPMQFTIDGPFANVANMLESLDQTGSRLAIQQVQFASQEGESDQVSANVNLVAFLAKPTTTKSGTQKTASSMTTSTNIVPSAKTPEKTIAPK